MKRYINLIVFLVLSMTSLALTGCNEKEAHAETSKTTSNKSNKKAADIATDSDSKSMQRPINVKIEKLESSSLTEYLVANGITRASRELTYSAEIPGRIEALGVDIGDKVFKGRILARIDYSTLQAQTEQAATSYNLAQSTYNRLSTLQDQDIISRQRIDEAKAQMESAKAGLSIAEANLKKAVVKATYPGIVGAKFAEKGEYVGPGSPLFLVVDYKTIIVEARIPETQVSFINRNGEAEVYIEAMQKNYVGKVDTLIPTADKESKTFTLRLKIDNPKHEILIGMSAVVKLSSMEHNNVITIPQSAVIEDKGEKCVFVANNDTAEKRAVILGSNQGDRVIVKQGLSQGEQLVVIGQRDLENGRPIRIIE